ncbi:MAG: hypothetical protein CSA45_04040 [Gammaproteobacteria bacterium]|nr:MAG: hypothetical protein CSA45_04040 [Gammaproteobacteria bacterium]
MADSAQSIPDKLQKQRRNRLLLLFFGIVLLAVCILTVFYWFKTKPTYQSHPPAVVLPFVDTMPVTLSDNRVRVSTGGFVTAKVTANVTPQVSGKLIRLSPQLIVGAKVSQGDFLAQIDTSDYQAAVANANANVANAQNNYAQARGQARQAARDIKRLGLKATDLNLRKPQLAAAKAAINNAEAQAQLAQTNLQRTTVTAPFDATVIGSDVAVGETAGPTTLLATLASNDFYTVKLTVGNQAIKFITVGNSVTLTDSIYGTTYRANITRIAPNLDQQNRTLSVYVDIANPLQAQHPLLLNSYLNAVIEGSRIANSAYIPNSAIVGNQYVWIKQADDTIHQVPITLVYRQNNQSLVTTEKPIAALITHAKDSFSEGQRVTTNRTIDQKEEKSKRESERQDKEQQSKAQQGRQT